MSALPRRISPEAPARRGWCPSLARPMPTGDGLLARVHPPLGVLSAGQLHAVANAARQFGNGHVDVTARGNLQIRGVTEATARTLAGTLADAGLGDVRADGGPQRLTLTSPLAGLTAQTGDDGLALAHLIEAAGLGIAGLPAKTLVAVEGEGLATAEADILLCPDRNGGIRIRLAAENGGHAEGAIAASETEAASTVAMILNAFASSGRRRVRDLSADERAAILARNAGDRGIGGQPGSMPCADTTAEPPGTAPFPAGVRTLEDGRVVVAVEAPFGRCDADALDRLVDTASDLSTAGIRTTPTRGFILVCETAETAEPAMARLAEAGFITEPNDPRRAIAACPGAPACASGSTPTLRDAARLAQAFAPLAAAGLTAHVSGCAKGCAHPAVADLTLVGSEGGYGIVLRGTPGALPARHLTFEAALERVRSAASTLSLDDAFRTLS